MLVRKILVADQSIAILKTCQNYCQLLNSSVTSISLGFIEDIEAVLMNQLVLCVLLASLAVTWTLALINGRMLVLLYRQHY